MTDEKSTNSQTKPSIKGDDGNDIPELFDFEKLASDVQIHILRYFVNEIDLNSFCNVDHYWHDLFFDGNNETNKCTMAKIQMGNIINQIRNIKLDFDIETKKAIESKSNQSEQCKFIIDCLCSNSQLFYNLNDSRAINSEFEKFYGSNIATIIEDTIRRTGAITNKLKKNEIVKFENCKKKLNSFVDYLEKKEEKESNEEKEKHFHYTILAFFNAMWYLLESEIEHSRFCFEYIICQLNENFEYFSLLRYILSMIADNNTNVDLLFSNERSYQFEDSIMNALFQQYRVLLPCENEENLAMLGGLCMNNNGNDEDNDNLKKWFYRDLIYFLFFGKKQMKSISIDARMKKFLNNREFATNTSQSFENVLELSDNDP